MNFSIKDDFPIFKNNPGLVYLDSAASAQKPLPVIAAMADFLSKDYANIHRGLYPLSERAGAAWESARSKAAAFAGADPDEIIFTRGTTSSLNFLARALAGGEAFVSAAEHHSNLLPWAKHSARMRTIPIAPDGTADLEWLEKNISPEARAVAITGQSNVTGAMNDIARASAIAHAAGAVLVCDAAQLATHAPLDAKKLGADFIAFSGHKIYGPTGIGVLYGRRERLSSLEPFEYGGDMVERCLADGSCSFARGVQKFEAGTMPLAEAAGLGAAFDFMKTLDYAHIERLTLYAHGKLAQIPGYRPISPLSSGGIISFNIDGASAFDLAALLGKRGICVRAGHHCAQPLHELFGIAGSLRVSFGAYNDTDDIDALGDAIREALEILS